MTVINQQILMTCNLVPLYNPVRNQGILLQFVAFGKHFSRKLYFKWLLFFETYKAKFLCSWLPDWRPALIKSWMNTSLYKTVFNCLNLVAYLSVTSSNFTQMVLNWIEPVEAISEILFFEVGNWLTNFQSIHFSVLPILVVFIGRTKSRIIDSFFIIVYPIKFSIDLKCLCCNGSSSEFAKINDRCASLNASTCDSICSSMN